MVDKKRASCAAGSFVGDMINLGLITDETTHQAVKDLHSKAKMAGSFTRNDKLLSWMTDAELALRGAHDPLTGFFSKYTGTLTRDLLRFTMKPADVVGVELVDRVGGVFENFKKQFPKATTQDWNKHGAPVLKRMYQEVKDHFPPEKQDYLKNYMDAMIDGAAHYSKVKQSVPSTIATNVLKNFVGNNPAITLLNVFEILPKTYAWARMNGLGNKGFFTAVSQLYKDMRKYGHRRVPELDAKGVYGKFTKSSFPMIAAAQDKFGVESLLDFTENPFRTFTYRLGEQLGEGQGLRALEEVTFNYRAENSPQMFWKSSDKNLFALMRYTIGTNEFILKMAANAFGGSRPHQEALLAFAALQIAQTGINSAIPGILWPVLPEDLKEEFKEFEKSIPVANLTEKIIGQDYSEYTQVLNVPVIGIGLNLAQQDLENFGRALAQTPGLLYDQQYLGAITNLATAAMYGGQIFQIPGLNFTSARLMGEVHKAAVGEIEWSNLAEEILIRTKVLPEEYRREF